LWFDRGIDEYSPLTVNPSDIESVWQSHLGSRKTNTIAMGLEKFKHLADPHL
jgi:hypothetical protein